MCSQKFRDPGYSEPEELNRRTTSPCDSLDLQTVSHPRRNWQRKHRLASGQVAVSKRKVAAWAISLASDFHSMADDAGTFPNQRLPQQSSCAGRFQAARSHTQTRPALRAVHPLNRLLDESGRAKL